MKKLVYLFVFVISLSFLASCDDNSTESTNDTTQYSINFSAELQSYGSESQNYMNNTIKPLLPLPALFGESLSSSFSTSTMLDIATETLSQNSSFPVDNSKTAAYDKKLDSIFNAFDTNTGNLNEQIKNDTECKSILYGSYHITITKGSTEIHKKDYVFYMPYIINTRWLSEFDNASYFEFLTDSTCKVNILSQTAELKYKRAKATAINILKEDGSTLYTITFSEKNNSKKLKVKIGGTDYVFNKESF